MLISDDGGNTWRVGEAIVSPPGNIHACLAALDDGRALAYLRTGGAGGFIWRTDSGDGGESWSRPQPTAIPNPNAGLDLIRLRGGDLLLACNPVARGRTPLALLLASGRRGLGAAIRARKWAGRILLPDAAAGARREDSPGLHLAARAHSAREFLRDLVAPVADRTGLTYSAWPASCSRRFTSRNSTCSSRKRTMPAACQSASRCSMTSTSVAVARAMRLTR